MEHMQSRHLRSKELLDVLADVNQRKKSIAESRKSSLGSGNSGKSLKDPSRIKLNSLPGFVRLGSDNVSPTRRLVSFPLFETASTVAEDSPYSRQQSYVPSRTQRLADLRGKMIGTDKLRSSTWSNVTSPRSSRTTEAFKPVAARVTPVEIYLESINDPIKDPREVVVTVNSYRLTRGELRGWLQGSSEVSSVVDAYFSILQEQSRKAAQADNSPRCLLGNTDVTRAIFARSDSMHCDEYVFRYDLAFYPLHEQNWTLVLIDIRERKVTYYDPTKRNVDFTEVLINLFHFFKSEMAYHENRNIEETTWRDLSYLAPELFPRFQPRDSAAVICKVAELLIKRQRVELQTYQADDYRREVLQTLVAHSLKL